MEKRFATKNKPYLCDIIRAATKKAALIKNVYVKLYFYYQYTNKSASQFIETVFYT